MTYTTKLLVGGVLSLVFLGLLQLLLLQQQSAFSQNSNTTTYGNEKYGFAFDYPSNWKEEEGIAFAATMFETQIVGVESPVREITEDGTEVRETDFSVSASNLTSRLDLKDLQVKNLTAQDYAIEESSFMLPPSSYGMSFEIGKNGTVSVAGKDDAWRIDSIVSSVDSPKQGFTSTIFVVNGDRVYRLDFNTNPLKVPEMMPTFEKILKSFRFI